MGNNNSGTVAPAQNSVNLQLLLQEASFKTTVLSTSENAQYPILVMIEATLNSSSDNQTISEIVQITENTQLLDHQISLIQRFSMSIENTETETSSKSKQSSTKKPSKSKSPIKIPDLDGKTSTNANSSTTTQESNAGSKLVITDELIKKSKSIDQLVARKTFSSRSS